MRQRLMTLMRRFINRLHQILFETQTELLELMQGVTLIAMSLVMGTVGQNMYRFPAFDLIEKFLTPIQLGLILLPLGVAQIAILMYGSIQQRGMSSVFYCFGWFFFASGIAAGDPKNFLFVMLCTYSGSSFFLARRRQMELMNFEIIELMTEELRAKEVLAVEELISLRLMEARIAEINKSA